MTDQDALKSEQTPAPEQTIPQEQIPPQEQTASQEQIPSQEQTVPQEPIPQQEQTTPPEQRTPPEQTASQEPTLSLEQTSSQEPSEPEKNIDILLDSKETLPDNTQVQPQSTESFFSKNRLAIIGGVVGLILITVGVGIVLSLGNSSKLEGMLNKRLNEIQTEQSQSLLQTDSNQNSEIPFSSMETTPKAPLIVPTE